MAPRSVWQTSSATRGSTIKAIEIQEKLYGQTRVPLETYYNFAYQLGQQGRTKEAKEYALRALEGARKYRGEAHPHTKKYARLLQELEDGHSIELPEVKFRESLIPRRSVTAR
jgi:tetratricopeptide (TPR) repeat protein